MHKDNKNQHTDQDTPGFLLLQRNIENSKYYFAERFTKSSAWIDLIIKANYFESCYHIRGINVTVSRGQVGFSLVTLAQRWRWSIKKVKRFLDDLKRDGKITYQNTNVTTLITLLNYDQEQNISYQMTHQKKTRRKPNDLHNNNISKEDKERDENSIPPKPENIESYFNDQGVSDFKRQAETFMDHYDSVGWKVGKNKMVDWRAAVRGWIKRSESFDKEVKSETPKKLPYNIIPQN